MQASQYSESKIRRLARKADAGDAKALKELRALNQKLVNNVNRRIKRIEDAGIDSLAVDTLREWLESENKKVLSKSTKLTTEELLDQIRKARSFLGTPSGNLKQARIIHNKRIKALQKLGVNIKNAEDYEKFKAFTRTEAFRDMVDFDSDRTLEEGWQALNSGKSLEKLNEEYEKYKKNEKAVLLDVWRNWTKIE